MYKSDWEQIVARLVPSNGGAVEQLVSLSRHAMEEIHSQLPGLWGGNEAKRNDRLQKSKEAAAQLIGAIREISSSGVIREIQQIRSRFEVELVRFPEGEELFRIGLAALSELEGAYDNLVRNQSIDRVPAFASPALRLGEFYRSLVASRALFNAASEAPLAAGRLKATLEIDGITTIDGLSDWMISLRALFWVAEQTDQPENELKGSSTDGGLQFLGIESGSPIRISIEAAERAMLKFLSLVQIGVRAVFRLCTPEGRIRDRLALIQEFRAAGVLVPSEAEVELSKALVSSMERLNTAMVSGRGSAITINGERIEPTISQVPVLESDDVNRSSISFSPRLRGSGL